MADIHVTSTGAATFRVEVDDGASKTVHNVTASRSDVERFGGGAPGERLVQVSFEFLLEREPKESILRSFDLPVIGRYFPEYEQEIRRRLP